MSCFSLLIKRLKPKNKKGFLGLDTMGSLIVIMILTGAIIAGVAQLIDSSKVSNMRNGLNSLNMGVRQLFVGGSDYSDLGTTDATAMLIAADIVPESLLNSKGDDILTPWGGDITVVASSAAPSATFTITVNDVPQDACIKLTSGNQSAWDSVKIGDAAITTLALANSTCGATATDNDIVFTAR